MAEVDCMDERTFLYGEEDILSERLMQKNYRTYYKPTVSITHLGSASVKKSSPDSKKRMLKVQKESNLRCWCSLGLMLDISMIYAISYGGATELRHKMFFVIPLVILLNNGDFSFLGSLDNQGRQISRQAFVVNFSLIMFLVIANTSRCNNCKPNCRRGSFSLNPSSASVQKAGMCT